MTKLIPAATEIMPRNEAEAWDQAARVLKAELFFDGLASPPETDAAAVERLLDRHDALGRAHDAFMRDMARTGVIDRARLRELLAVYGETRRDFLTLIGADPESEDLLPFPADLQDA